MKASEVVDCLGLVPLAGEGGRWAQTWLDANGSAIYFLLQPDDVSVFHRLAGVELYHFYGGAPAELWLLHADGSSRRQVLGLDLAAGHRPVEVVPAGTWQGSRTLGAWTLLGCTMAPPFREDEFELAQRNELVATYPERAEVITALTPPPGVGLTPPPGVGLTPPPGVGPTFGVGP